MTLWTLLLLLVAGGFVVTGIRAVKVTIALRRLGAGGERRDHDMPRVSSYVRDMAEGAAILPDRTWNDLDMDEVFKRLDRTASWPGQHLLYARLRREDHALDALREFEAGVTRMSSDGPLRARIASALRPMDNRRAAALPFLFHGPAPKTPPFAPVYPLLTVAGIIGLAAAFWHPPLVLLPVFLALANVFIRLSLRDRMERVLPAMRAIPSLLAVSQSLAGLHDAELVRPLDVLRHEAPRLRSLGRVSRWVGFESFGPNELANALYEYVNMLFLLDVTAFAWGIRAMCAEREAIRRIYEALGELDVLQSVAVLRAETTRWTRPEFRDGSERACAVTAITHPMLDNAVPNSLEIDGRSVLLTGSNMSGKSTFIRTLGVNAILAQTLHTVFAEHWLAPRIAVRTSIGRADSLLEGRSYYQAEVEAVGALLAPGGARQRLILIDELFRGTNSIERVAAAKAVLTELDRGSDLVIVATHDVELLELMPGYAPFHFREDISNGQLTFDYMLRTGACSTRNALAILELAGFPAHVVADATQTAGDLERRVGRRVDTKV